MEATLHGIELMIDVFMRLDKANPDGVNKEELIRECEAQKLDAEQVTKWLEPFGMKTIRMDEFCNQFGFNLNEMILEEVERASARSGEAPKLSEDIELISTTMSLTKQVEITEKFKTLVNESGGDEANAGLIPKKMKQYLDETFEHGWQVVMVEGKYWMHFSHEPFTSLQFRYNDYICLVWRTPEN
ncbi:Tegument antigen [Clonorchis sinensis]|uniref:Tegument antigen n=2 Tax=Clonorchis sinensis TaxID=79923 RepID=A0A8T1MJK8_CLOSI|nr:Tegument antigen [Clonorchis sinensis]GAA30036.1 tegument antigen [Clonorchis sinensis]